MRSGRARQIARILGISSLLATASPAAAQTARAVGALDRFDPAPAGDSFYGVPGADVSGRVRISAALLFSYAHDPLVLRRLSGGTTVDWVSREALLHGQVSIELWKRLKLDIDIPGVLTVGGTSGSLGTVMVSAPSGSHVADLRFGARLALLHQHGFIPAAGLTLSVWAPVGSASSFSGAGVVRFQPGAVIGAEYTHFLWGASVGTRFQPQTTDAVVGSQITGGVAAAARFLDLTIGPELYYGFSLGDPRQPLVSQTTGTNAELLLAARYRLGPIAFGLGAGPGLGRGPGTPTYRVIAGINGTFDALPANGGDDDGDGRGNGGARRPPPTTAPPQPEGPLDTDGDGVPDAEDACPTIIGDATPGAYRRGCPPDRDRDGIPDADDACPDVPGVASSDPKKNGCPADSDGDGIPDDKDACPYEKGKPNADPKLNGCPTAVRVEGSQIVILQQINFETGKDILIKDSFPILEQVAAVLVDHPEIARLAVDGHTDNQGFDKANLNLSERRALTVVRWLIDHGIDARRLEARGFGQRRPIADNKLPEGRAKNRRVEFQIRRRTTLGAAGWEDGPVDEPAAPTTPAPPLKPPVKKPVKAGAK